ncbi:MAG: AAA family ATPase [Treponema sp.]|jgi:flagellar biosynthesis protein FlhF|nr:AAA family ATPase [Treponema sp.]
METFTEQAYTEPECIAKMRAKYGERIQILNRKTIRMGGFMGFFTREGVELTGYIPMGYAAKAPNTWTGFGGDYQFSGMETGEKRTPYGKAPEFRNTPVPRNGPVLPKEPWDLEKEKQKVLAAANRGGDAALLKVLSEVKDIKEMLDAPREGETKLHPSIDRVGELLEGNDFSPAYCRLILERLKKECSLEDLEDFTLVQDRVLEWIGESICLYCWPDTYRRKPAIIALVGPTGVGKTTTIAKLAASLGIDKNGNHVQKIALVTIDAYRIAAKQQLETYGEILEFPVFFAAEYDELRKTIALNSAETDIILIDTIGRSPRDSSEIGAMKEVLDACGSRAEIYLVLSAATKRSDLEEILRQFEPFNYRSIIVTKLDETVRTGNVISALADKAKSAVYITNGQTPVDIRRADVFEFLIRLEGFTVNRQKLEDRFGGKGKEIRS